MDAHTCQYVIHLVPLVRVTIPREPVRTRASRLLIHGGCRDTRPALASDPAAGPAPTLILLTNHTVFGRNVEAMKPGRARRDAAAPSTDFGRGGKSSSARYAAAPSWILSRASLDHGIGGRAPRLPALRPST